jgi:hypothetical protein
VTLPSELPTTPEARKNMRAELISVVADLSWDPGARADEAIKKLQRQLPLARLDGDQQLLAKATAIIAIKEIMLNLRQMCGREPYPHEVGK